LESGADYILQLLGVTGSIAGQSLFGIIRDFSVAISEATGIPTFLIHILFVEVLIQIIFELIQMIKKPGHMDCIYEKIYKFLDYIPNWILTDIFPSGFLHLILRVIFAPARILFYLITAIIGTIYCDLISPNSDDCKKNC